MAFHNWTHSQTSPPPSWLDPRPAKKRSGICIIKCTSKKDCLDLCHVDQKGPEELTRDIMSSLKKLPKAGRGWAGRDGCSTDLERRTPHGRERGGTSAKIKLAKATEAHQRALATTMALRGRYRVTESLHNSGMPCCTHVPSQSWDWRKRRSQGWSRWHHAGDHQRAAWPTPQHAPHHDGRVRRWSQTWGAPRELGPDVEGFFGAVQQVKKMRRATFSAEPPS